MKIAKRDFRIFQGLMEIYFSRKNFFLSYKKKNDLLHFV